MSASGLLTVALALWSPQAPSAEAATVEVFIEACISSAGERTTVAEVARARGWAYSDLGSRFPEAHWADSYQTASGVLFVKHAPRLALPSDQPQTSSPAPRLIASRPEMKECTVVLESQPGTWRDAAAAMDASPLLIALPEDRQPEGLPGQVLRNYHLANPGTGNISPPRASITQDPESGRLTISIYRLPRRSPENQAG